MKIVSLWVAETMLFLLVASAAFGNENEFRWNDYIDIAGGVTGMLQGSPSSSMFTPDDDGTISASVAFDIELTVRTSESGTVYVLFESGNGSGLDYHIPTFSGFNDTVNDDFKLHLSEAWYEHSLGEKVRIRGGKIDITTDFDANAIANSETDQFLSGGFVNNPAAAFPDNGFGAMIWVSPNDLFDIGFGYTDAAAEWDDSNVFKNPFVIMELDLKPNIAGKQGNYRFYGWYNGEDHERFDFSDDPFSSNYGFGVSADQEVAEGVTVFARYGHQRSVVSEIEHAWSAGLEISGKFSRREEDSIGLAFGQAIVGDDLKSLFLEDDINFGNEHHLEIYYKIKANNHLDISPNLQWVKNPCGENENSAWAAGLRARVSF